MQAKRKRNIQSGEKYNHFFPAAENSTATIQKNASVQHTVAFIPKVVHETLYHTKNIAAHLKANTIHETCSNIWHFVYGHIAYKKDADGYEQIRSPARAWHDRFKGVDCDCYSVFISSILTNLKIPHILRITKYHRDYFQHIYPIVPTQNGYITVDCVTDQFDYEVPFSEKKDYPMDLQYLNGFDENTSLYNNQNDNYLMGAGDGMDDLGKILQSRFAANRLPSRTPKVKRRSKTALNSDGTKKQKGFKKFLNKFNRLNPLTLTLRNGVLASMKLNIRNVGGRLRWSYLTPQEALKRGINPAKFQKLVATRQKLERIFYKAGGKIENLKKAILKGKGNKDHAVSGLDGFEGFDGAVEYMNEYTPLGQLLGTEIYQSENIDGMEGMGELGEPITLATIAAASGVIAGIVGMLKQVGDIFQKKGKGSEDFDPAKNEQADRENPVANTATDSSGTATTPAEEETTLPAVRARTAANNSPALKENPTTDEASATDKATDKTDNDKPAGFWDSNKKWLKPTAIGLGGIALIAIGIKMFKGSSSNATSNKSSPKGKAMNGTPKKKNHHRKGKSRHHPKKAVALM